MAPEWAATTDGVNFAQVVVEIGKHLAPNAAVTSDAGNFSSFIHRYIGFKPGMSFLSSVVGAMGAGVPMAALSARHAAEAIMQDRISALKSAPTAMPGGTSMASHRMGPARSRS
jgi:thiamine pyrophosphate-dependent acetolactate synthase large subunit-like protein